MLPYLNASRAAVSLDPALSQDAVDGAKLSRRIAGLLTARSAAAVCSHRPVLPRIFEALDLDPVALAPGGVVVAHRRDGKVLSVEHYDR
jgi:8-oxo-dGTP diphosphatase